MTLRWTTGYNVDRDGTRTTTRRRLDLDDPVLYSITNGGGNSGEWQIHCGDKDIILDEWKGIIGRHGTIRQEGAPPSERLYALAPGVGIQELAERQKAKEEAAHAKWIAKIRTEARVDHLRAGHNWEVDYLEVMRNSQLSFAVKCHCGDRGWYVETGYPGLAYIIARAKDAT